MPTECRRRDGADVGLPLLAVILIEVVGVGSNAGGLG